jgi:protein-S-isoprenylcysteine O-methyltransferase Ste14
VPVIAGGQAHTTLHPVSKRRIMMKSRANLLMGIILTIVTVGQIVLSIVLYNSEGIDWLANAGWVVLAISAIFGWLPIYTLRRKGGVSKKKNYMQTTKVVDSGIYGIVRHPQYLAGVQMSIAMPMIAQHWLVAVFGAVAILIYYLDTFSEERSSIEKFGDDYRRYMERVPRMNFFLGMVRKLSSKQRGED